MVVEVANSGIPWMEPRDLSLDALGAAGAKSPALTVSSYHGPREDFFFTYDHGCGANVAMADGSVHYLPPGSLSTGRLRKILQVGGYKERERFRQDSYDEGRRSKLAQHRLAGRMAAFGRPLLSSRGAKQEGHPYSSRSARGITSRGA